MSDVLGDATPYDRRFAHTDNGTIGDYRDIVTDDIDDAGAEMGTDDDDESFDTGEPGAVARFFSGVLPPGAFAIASLVVAVMSLLGPFVGYPITAGLNLSHRTSLTYSERAMAICELAFCGIAIAFALVARVTANAQDEPDKAVRGVRSLAGAALVVSVVSVAQAVVTLIIVAGVHTPSPFGN